MCYLSFCIIIIKYIYIYIYIYIWECVCVCVCEVFDWVWCLIEWVWLCVCVVCVSVDWVCVCVVFDCVCVCVCVCVFEWVSEWVSVCVCVWCVCVFWACVCFSVCVCICFQDQSVTSRGSADRVRPGSGFVLVLWISGFFPSSSSSLTHMRRIPALASCAPSGRGVCSCFIHKVRLPFGWDVTRCWSVVPLASAYNASPARTAWITHRWVTLSWCLATPLRFNAFCLEMRRVCVFCMRVAFINTQNNKRDATRRSCIRVRNDENLRLVIVASGL